MYNRYWKVYTSDHSFKRVLIFYGKENDLRPYLESEVTDYSGYTGASDEDVKAAKQLGLPVYMI